MRTIRELLGYARHRDKLDGRAQTMLRTVQQESKALPHQEELDGQKRQPEDPVKHRLRAPSEVTQIEIEGAPAVDVIVAPTTRQTFEPIARSKALEGTKQVVERNLEFRGPRWMANLLHKTAAPVRTMGKNLNPARASFGKLRATSRAVIDKIQSRVREIRQGFGQNTLELA